MKSISSRIVWAIAKLCAALAAILGCSPKNPPDQPHQLHWQGRETGYQGTTVVPTGDHNPNNPWLPIGRCFMAPPTLGHFA
jgi:hypothetical protein